MQKYVLHDNVTITNEIYFNTGAQFTSFVDNTPVKIETIVAINKGWILVSEKSKYLEGTLGYNW